MHHAALSRVERRRRRRCKWEQAISLSLLAVAAYRIFVWQPPPALHNGIVLFSPPNTAAADADQGSPITNNSTTLETTSHEVLLASAGSTSFGDFDDDVELVERSLQQYMHQQRLALVNESSVVQYERIYEHFFNETILFMQTQLWLGDERAYCAYNNETMSENFLYIFKMDLNKDDGSDILSGMLCCAVDGFFATGGIKKHVLFSMVNSNRGEFSNYIPNRTRDSGYHNECRGREHAKYYQYLNHPNVSLVVTMQHQHLDHPKVLSLPLGQQSNAAGALQKQSNPDWVFLTNQTNLLLINCNASPTRTPIIQRVIANFGGNITNKKDPTRVDEYFQQLSTSKYILSPSGMGWDCYRTWEAIILGCIPILETYYRQDGLYRTYDDLPVLWVDHYDNVTPSLLEREYPRILSRAREYKFEKLTTQWWIDLINRHRS